MFRLGAGMGLNIGAVSAKKLQQPFDRQTFGDIDETRSRRSSVCPAGLPHICCQDGTLGAMTAGLV